MELIFKNAWILFIIVTLFNAYWLKSKSKSYILENPELEEGYNRIFKSIIIYGNIPWVIVAIGNLSGMTNSMFDFFRPRDMNPIVLLFHTVVILILVLSIWWIYFKDGAEFLERHPGLLKKKSFLSERTDMTAKEIKAMLSLMLLSGIAGMVMMWIMDIPTFK